MIRWKFVIPFFLITGLVIAFFVVMFDPILERALEKGGGKINGARVDIAGLDTKIFKGRLTIQDIQIANPDVEFSNTVQAGPLAFQLNFPQLLKKRFIIPDASVEGIRFDTERKVSGKLPKRIKKKKKKDEKPSIASRLAEKYKGRFQMTLDKVKLDAKEKVEFDPKETQISKKADELKKKSDELPDQWKKRIDDLNVDGRVEQVEKDIKEIKSTPTQGVEAIVAIPKAITKLGEVKNDIKKIKTDVTTTKSDLQSEIKKLKDDVKSLEQAKQADLDDLASRFNLDFTDPNRLVEGIVGPVVLARTQKILRYVEMVREHLPSKKEEETIPKKPRAEGMDILFPRPEDPPRFWLKKSSLSGQLNEITASGALNHLNSNPGRVGKPTTMDLKGQKGTHKFGLRLSVDHTGDVKKDGFSLSANDIKLTKLVSGGAFAKALEGGFTDAKMAINVIGDNNIGGHIQFDLSKLKFNRDILYSELKVDNAFQKSFANNLVQSIETLPTVVVKGKITGTWDNPSLAITSNLKNAFSSVIKKTVGNVVKEQRAKLEAQMNQILNKEKAALNAKISEFQNTTLKELGLKDDQIQSQIDEATGINLAAPSGENAGEDLLKGIEDIFQ